MKHMVAVWDRCVELKAKSVNRNKGSETRAGKAADKVSVSGMIHCSTQGHDLDQGLVMDPAQREKGGEGEGRKRQQERDRGKVCVDCEHDA